jgi:uncharacterized protein YndB with AHSA1/START domain
MEHGMIERQIHIDATPEVAFDVVSSPVHLRAWWPDEAEYATAPGSTGRIGFDQGNDIMAWQQFTVVEAIPHRLFSFRWTHPEGAIAAPGNSFLVTFELEPADGGTLLRLTETGFRERGWDDAKVAAEHADHQAGWSHFLPRLSPYAAEVGASA